MRYTINKLVILLLILAGHIYSQVYFSHDTVCSPDCLNSDVYLYNQTLDTFIIDSIYAKLDTTGTVSVQGLVISMYPHNCYNGRYFVMFPDDIQFTVCDTNYLEIPPKDSVPMRFLASSCITCKKRVLNQASARGDTIIIDIYFYSQGNLIDSVKYVDIDYGGSFESPYAGNETNTISVYPNPINSTARIYYSTGQSNAGLVKIFNLSGKLVYVKLIRRSGYFVWNASGLSTGVYFLRAMIGEKQYCRKLLLQ